MIHANQFVNNDGNSKFEETNRKRMKKTCGIRQDFLSITVSSA